MKATMIKKPSPEVCDFAARMCYGAKDGHKALLSGMEGGHESLLEHETFTFHIEEVSRVLLAQLTRHRLASYSVRSQRYCGATSEYIIPNSIADILQKDEDLRTSFMLLSACTESFYNSMLEAGVPAEDARYFTFQAGTTELVMTMNIRELRHFLSLRCCNRAQWEIRELADEILKLCREATPDLFRDAGPGCVRGACPEGKRSCGSPREELKVE